MKYMVGEKFRHKNSQPRSVDYRIKEVKNSSYTLIDNYNNLLKGVFESTIDALLIKTTNNKVGW